MVVVFGDRDGDCFGWWSIDGYGDQSLILHNCSHMYHIYVIINFI